MTSNDEGYQLFEIFREAVTEVRKLRATYRLPMSRRIPVHVRPTAFARRAFVELREPFERMCNADLTVLPCRAALPSEEDRQTHE